MAAIAQDVPGAAAERSQGVWAAAWARLKQDRVGVACLGLVVAFMALILLSAAGRVAGGWQIE